MGFTSQVSAFVWW